MGSDSQTEPRIHGLDAYRGVLMMLGIVIHVGMIFLPAEWGGWSDYPVTWESHGVSWSVSFVHLFRMPAFFVLAGFFAALLWKRYGLRQMLENRFDRIVLPFGVFVFALPPAVDVGFTFLGTAAAGNGSPWTVAYEAAEAQNFWPDDTMHLWFLYDLMCIVVLGAVAVTVFQRLRVPGTWLRGFVRRTVESPWRSLLVFGLANGLWWLPLRWDSIPTNSSWDAWFQSPMLLAYYLVCYGIGWVIYVADTDVQSLRLRAWTLTLLGLVGSVVYYGAGFWLDGYEEQPDVIPPPEIVAAYGIRVMGASIALVGLSRGLAGLFMRYANSESPRWRYLSDSSYWVYLVHLPLCGFVSAFVGGLPLPVWIQFPLGMLGVVWLSLLTYDVGVRTTFWGRFLNGRRYPAAGRKRSAAILVLTMGCLVAVPFEGSGRGESPSPWRDRGVPAVLLVDEEVIDPLHEAPPVLPGVDLSRCIGVRNYAICPDAEEYNDAIAACVALGGSLASFETEEENTEVVDLVHLLMSEPLRVGITDEAEDGRWVWLSGVELDYDPWDEGQPDNHGGKESCAGINFFGERTWHDVPCDWEIGFVCELPSVED